MVMEMSMLAQASRKKTIADNNFEHVPHGRKDKENGSVVNTYLPYLRSIYLPFLDVGMPQYS